MIRSVIPRPLRPTFGFTLVELIMVMLLLATLMAIAAPQMGRFFRGREVIEECRRIAALTRMARAEAISQGQSYEVWFDADQRQYGMRSESPYFDTGRSEITYDLAQDLTFRLPAVDRRKQVEATILFRPDGLIAPESAMEVVLVEGEKDLMVLQLEPDRLSYKLRGPADATI